MRLALPVVFQVRKNAVSPSTTMCTAVGTGVPSLRNVVSRTYLAREIAAKYPGARPVSSGVLMPSQTRHRPDL
jgi:hypothetical protein